MHGLESFDVRLGVGEQLKKILKVVAQPVGAACREHLAINLVDDRRKALFVEPATLNHRIIIAQ
jgi:hypothetical protein